MKKVKSAINFLQTVKVYAYDVEREPHPISGRLVNIQEPKGELHLFELTPYDDLVERSYCGKSLADIGELTNITDKHILPLCKTCMEKRKADPRSPWANYMKSFAPVKSSRKKKKLEVA